MQRLTGDSESSVDVSADGCLPLYIVCNPALVLTRPGWMDGNLECTISSDLIYKRKEKKKLRVDG